MTTTTIYSAFPRSEATVSEWLDFELSFAGYSSLDYTCTYYFVCEDAQYEITTTQNASGTFQFQIEVPNTTIGKWSYEAYAVDTDTHKFIVDSGVVTLNQSLINQTTGADQRSKNKIIFDLLEAALTNKITKDQQYYMIEGRALSAYSMEDIERLYFKFKDIVAQEEKAERQKAGLATGKHVTRYR